MRRLLLGLYVAAFGYVQLSPKRQVPESDPVLELLIHIGLYLILGVLLAWTFRQKEWIVLLVGLVFATGLEAIQAWIPGRNPDVHDLVGNIVGVLLATGVASAWKELHTPPYPEVKA